MIKAISYEHSWNFDTLLEMLSRDEIRILKHAENLKT